MNRRVFGAVRQGRVKDAGFTLVETLVAFAILALTLTIVFNDLTHLLSGGETAVKRRAALRVAQGKLDDVTSLPPGFVGTRSGRTDGGLRWVVLRTPVSVLGISAQIFETRVSVWIQSNNNIGPDVSLVSLNVTRTGS